MVPPVAQILADLISINSINSSYEGGPGEGAIAAWVKAFFEVRGVDVSEQEVFPGRPNIIAKIPGRDRARKLVLEAHMDTVSVAGMEIPPFEPRVANGRMFGRGSCDTKAGLAAMMHAVASIQESGIQPPCDLWLAAVVDEEFSYRGVVKLCDGLRADAALVAEPTGLRPVIASKGVVRWRIAVHGRSAHSGKPHLGVNAIQHMARILLLLERDHESLAGHSHPLLGPATLNVGVIKGGVQVNFVPDHCVIEVDRRLLPGETVRGVLDHYQSLMDSLKREYPALDVRMEEPMLTDMALETDPGAAPAVLASLLLGEMGLDGGLCGVPFGSDASKLSACGVPSIVIGPGSIDQAHAAVEYVDLAEVEKAAEFYKSFALRFGAA